MKKYVTMIALICAVVFTASAFAKDATTVNGVVNVNTATKEELVLVPWIGEVRADEIIAVRAQKPFAQIEDLLLIKGIGEKTLAKIAQYIAFEGETTIQKTKLPAGAQAQNQTK